MRAETVLEHRVLSSDDPEAVNSPDHQPVDPELKDKRCHRWRKSYSCA